MQLETTFNFWREKNIDTVEKLKLALENFNILFAYNSGNIENERITFNDTREIFDKGNVIGYTGDLRTLFEIQNQKKCVDFICENVLLKKPLTVSLIKDINRILCENTLDERRYNINKERAGEFKKHDYVTGKNEIGCAACDVEKEIISLVGEVINIKTDKILTVCAYFHCKFEQIHPFSDGNGRTGRTLINYLLLTNNLPPLIVFENDRNYYYDALQKFDEQEEIQPMENFLSYCLTKTWAKSLELANKQTMLAVDLKEENDLEL
ncbi:MAG: Fic family protein [Oscillospiraceae bacterium]